MRNHGVCRCGHLDKDHMPQKTSSVEIPEHGPCGYKTCSCKKFTWVKEIETRTLSVNLGKENKKDNYDRL